MGSKVSVVVERGSRAQAQLLWCTSLVALRHVGCKALAGRLFTTEPPRKAQLFIYFFNTYFYLFGFVDS